MSASKSIFRALQSSIGPLMAPGSPSAVAHPGVVTSATPTKTSASTHDLVLNNLATACRITKDVADALDKVPYLKGVTGVVAQIIKIHEEVQGNNDRCNEITSLVTKYSYTAIECLGELYSAEGERRLEGLKGELGSFQSYLETILNELELLKNQSRWKAYVKRDKDVEDMRRIKRELKAFVDRFTMKAVTVGVRDVGNTKPILSEIQQTILREHWLRSQHAQYNIAIVDTSPGNIDRAYCAPDTRKPILDRVTTWAHDQSPTSPAVFWMVGEGGAGKSTIARTIALKLDEDETFPTVVTFFCSRKFSDTNQQVYIIPTITYQLARLCPFYSSELLKDGDIVDSLKLVAKQMNTLLIQPWKASSGNRPLDTPPFLVIIDALDEIVSQEEGDGISGGFVFLKSLLTAVDQGYLKGIKFFVTSRPHPELSAACQSLSSEATCRLFDIPKNEVEQDIYRYLHHSLPKLQGPPDLELLKNIASKADGLFIFASTAVLVASLRGRATANEQRQALRAVLGGLTVRSTTTSPINSLYCQVLGDAFKLENDKALSDRLDLLHTIICTQDRVSIDILVSLVLNDGDEPQDVEEMVKDLINSLHAVLWISDGCITWYHASFLDFLISTASTSVALPERNLDASCDAHLQHTILARRCFSIMRSRLKFNICELPSSFLLDSEVDMATRIKDYISDALQYACRYWAIHTSKSIGHGMQDDIMNFLDQNLLFWIEAMNLVQQSSLCATLLNIVQQHVVQHYPATPDLCKHLSAASHFSTVFKGSPAARSTPHLYMSTLVYTAPRFPLLQRWRTRFARLPEIRAHGIGTQLLMTLNGHTGSVHSVAFSPNGSRIASGAFDHSVRVWDAETGEQIKVLNGHIGDINSIAFSPDGSRIVSGSDDYTVRLWDVQTGEEKKILEGHTNWVYSVVFSPDGTRIVSGARDYTVRFWDVETGEQIKALNGHIDDVNSVAFSPDGSRLASGSHDRSVRVWDVETGEEIKILDGHTNRVTSVAFSPECSRIVSGSYDYSVRVWDVETGDQIKVLNGHTSNINSVVFSPNGSRIVSGAFDHSVRVWDIETGEEIMALNGHARCVNSVAFSPDGARLVSGSDDRSVRIWDIETGVKVKRLNSHTSDVLSVAFSTDGSCIVSASRDHSVRIWDVETGEEIRRLDGHTNQVNSVAFSHDSSRIVSGSFDNSVRVWDVETGEQIKAIDGHNYGISSVAFSPDGSRIVSSSFKHSVRVWDIETGEQIMALNGHDYGADSVTFSPDGSRLVLGSDDYSIHVWDVETGSQIMDLKGHTKLIRSVAFSSDEARVVSGSDDHSVRIWDVKVGEEIMRLDGHTAWVMSVAFSSDGTRIVSGSCDRSVRVWDVNTGEEIVNLKGHTSIVNSVAFSADGSRIVSGSFDRSVRVWDVKVGEEVRTIDVHTDSARYNAPNNARILDDALVSPTPPLHQLNWTVNDDGWIVQTNTNNRIIWLPDTLTAYLYRPANTMIIAQQTATLDLAGVEFGSKWIQCYTP